MALCQTMETVLNEKFTQFNPYPSIEEVQNICYTTLKRALKIDHTNRHHLIKRLDRSLSAEGILSISNKATICNRTKSLYVRQSQLEQSNQSIEDDLNFTALRTNDIVIEEESTRYYSTKTPYQSPSQNHILSSPPVGYKPVSVQLLARHGSRTLNSHDYDLQALKVWQLAKQRNMLTRLGEQLKEDIGLFMDANNHVG
jgi:hypothetical protein